MAVIVWVFLIIIIVGVIWIMMYMQSKQEDREVYGRIVRIENMANGDKSVVDTGWDSAKPEDYLFQDPDTKQWWCWTIDKQWFAKKQKHIFSSKPLVKERHTHTDIYDGVEIIVADRLNQIVKLEYEFKKLTNENGSLKVDNMELATKLKVKTQEVLDLITGTHKEMILPAFPSKKR
ncbi:hypothetical protein K8R33_02790 [archaeon]|nr:hypothetical protein [archaeon]